MRAKAKYGCHAGGRRAAIWNKNSKMEQHTLDYENH